MNKLLLDKETFVNYMNFIDEQSTYACKINNLLQEAYSEMSFYPTLKYEEQLVSLLKIAMDDMYNDIEYFIYELDFGREYKDGCVTYTRGKDEVPVRLKTPEDLYDLLESNLVERNQ